MVPGNTVGVEHDLDGVPPTTDVMAAMATGSPPDGPQPPAVPACPLVGACVEISSERAGFRDEAGVPVVEKSPVAARSPPEVLRGGCDIRVHKPFETVEAKARSVLRRGAGGRSPGFAKGADRRVVGQELCDRLS